MHAQGPLPHARLLPADRRGRERRRRRCREIIQEMLLTTHLRAPGPRHRPRPGRARWRRRSRRATSDGPRLATSSPTRHRRLSARRTQHKSLLRFITCGRSTTASRTLIGRLLYDSQADLRGPARGARGGLASKLGTQGERDRLRAAGRRPRRRARAGHHHRRRLPLLLHRQAQVHRRRHARPRAVHPQHGHRRLDRRPRGDPDRRAQGRAHPDPPAQLPRRRCSASATSCWRSTRWTWSAIDQDAFRRASSPTTAPSPTRSASTTSPPSRSRRCAATTSPRAERSMPWYDGPTLMRASGDRRGRRATRPDGAVPPAGAVGQPAEPRLPRLRRHDRQRQRRARATRSRVLPSGRETARSRASSPRTAISTQAVAGQSVTLTLADEIDISARRRARRRADAPAEVADQFEATIVWMAEEPLLPGRPYLLKIGTQTVTGDRSPS